MAASHKRQLRNYLLNRQYQLRYTLIMVIISSVLTAGLGYVWYNQMRTTSRTIEVKALTSMSEQEAQVLKDDLAEGDQLRLMALVGFGVLFAVAVAIYSIILTHKVAGPLYKISRYMNEVRKGNLGPIYDLRKGDQLHDFYRDFKLMYTSLRQHAEEEVKLLDEVNGALERHLAQSGGQDNSELTRLLTQLRELRDAKDVSLQGKKATPSGGIKFDSSKSA